MPYKIVILCYLVIIIKSLQGSFLNFSLANLEGTSKIFSYIKINYSTNHSWRNSKTQLGYKKEINELNWKKFINEFTIVFKEKNLKL